jgi:hypothetical protein
MNILKDFFKMETPYPMKRMELLKDASIYRKQAILQQIMNRHNANELLKNRAIRLNNVKEMLFFYDDSLWGNAKGGVLITEQAIYFRQYSDDTVSRLDWDGVKGFNGVDYKRNQIIISFSFYHKSKPKEWRVAYTIFADQEQGVFINNLFERIFKFKQLQDSINQKIQNQKIDKEKVKDKTITLEKKKREAAAKRAAALKETEIKDKKRREQQEKERKRKELERQKIIDEKNKNGYFIEDEKSATAKGPFTQQDIQSMLDENNIDLKTKIKKGIDTKTFKTVVKYKEFTEGFEDFL